jgi:hypothetical protein
MRASTRVRSREWVHGSSVEIRQPPYGKMPDVTVRRLTTSDWADLWPMLQDFGTSQTEETALSVYAGLLADPRWALIGYDGTPSCSGTWPYKTSGRIFAGGLGIKGGYTTCTCGQISVGTESAGPLYRRPSGGQVSA